MSARTRAVGMSAVRAGFGLAAILTPDQAARLAGYPPAHVNATGRVFGGLFGVRELALAAIVVQARDDVASLRRAVVINAACDLGDAAVAAQMVLRRAGVDRGALMTVVPALLGAASWIRLHRELT